MKKSTIILPIALLISMSSVSAKSIKLKVELIKPCHFETLVSESQTPVRAGTDLHISGVVCKSAPGMQCQSQPSHGGDYITASLEEAGIRDISQYRDFHDETITIFDGSITKFNGKTYLCSEEF